MPNATSKCSKKPGEYCRLHNPAGFLSKEDFFASLDSNSTKKPIENQAGSESLYPITLASKLKEKFRTRLDYKFDVTKFESVQNPVDSEKGLINKPIGGLWMSATYKGESGEIESPWDTYVSYFRALNKTVNYDVTLKPTAKIMRIATKEDYLSAVDKYTHLVPDLTFTSTSYSFEDKKTLNYEKISEDFDALYIESTAIDQLSFNRFSRSGSLSEYTDLYGWDVPSLVAFNPKCFKLMQV